VGEYPSFGYLWFPIASCCTECCRSVAHLWETYRIHCYHSRNQLAIWCTFSRKAYF